MIRTEDLRLATFLIMKHHPVSGIELSARGYGQLLFPDSAQDDVDAFTDSNALVPARLYLDMYKGLVRQVAEYKNLNRCHVAGKPAATSTMKETDSNAHPRLQSTR